MTLSKIATRLALGAAVLAVSATATLAATATASVNVRSGPGTQYRVLDTLRPGERVTLVDQAGGWCAVSKTGPNGWVSCRYLTSDGRSGTYREAPSVSIQLGFGSQRPPRHNDDRWDRNDRWDRDDRGGYWSGPRSSQYPSRGNSFGFSFSN
jgi:uncharacterized protein YraI